MKKFTFAFAIILTLMLTFQPLMADEISNFVDQVFEKLDINKDGIIDKKDIQKYSKSDFELMDTDKDGKISKNEFFEFVCNKSCNQGNCECKNYKNKEDLDYMADYWQRTDRNKDGYISFEEKFEADMDNFVSLDYNGDGKVTRDEVESQMY